MNKKEYWIKIDNDDKVEEIRQFIVSLEPELLGEIPVILFNHNTRAVYRLSHVYDLSCSALNVLKEKYGDSNVKYTEYERFESEREVLETERQILSRIADALEGINCTLENIQQSVELLEPLADCVTSQSGYAGQLHITGNVTNY